MVTVPSLYLAPWRSPVAFSGDRISEANLPASSRIASTRSSVTSSQPGSWFTWSSPTTCFSTNCMSLIGATYSATSFSSASDFFRQLGHDLEKIAHQTVIGNLEDRRLRILVDRDDHLAVLHARQVLDGTRDADRDIELGGDDLAGLADLVIVRHEPRVDRGARSANGRAELVAECLEHLEILAA